MKLLKLLDVRQSANSNRKRQWALFLCPYCGKQVEKEKYVGIRDQSCGCYRKTFQKLNNIKHGDKVGGKASSLYSRYSHILDRCLNSNNKDYALYGGRGITICNEWKSNFSIFKEWALSNGYHPDLEIDRKDNDKGYNPENCRWITHKENIRNSRLTKLKTSDVKKIKIDIFVNKKPLQQIAFEFNMSLPAISCIKHGRTWSDVLI